MQGIWFGAEDRNASQWVALRPCLFVERGPLVDVHEHGVAWLGLWVLGTAILDAAP